MYTHGQQEWQRTWNCIPYSKVSYLITQRIVGSWRIQSGLEAGGIPDSWKPGDVGLNLFWRLWKTLIVGCQKVEGGKVTLRLPCSYVSLNTGCRLLSGPDVGLHGLLVWPTVTTLMFSWFQICQLPWIFLCDAASPDAWLLDGLWRVTGSLEDLEVFSTTLFIKKIFPIHICVAFSPDVPKVQNTFCSWLTKLFASKRVNYFLNKLQWVHRCIYAHNEACIGRTEK